VSSFDRADLYRQIDELPADSLEDLAVSSRARTLAAVKSLLSFGRRTGYLPNNIGAAVKLPARKDLRPRTVWWCGCPAHGLRFQLLREQLRRPALRAQVEALGGYDVTPMGAPV
jgi:hypothetical protein